MFIFHLKILIFFAFLFSFDVLPKEEGQSDMPVTHDSMRLIEQVKTVCEHRIYLDEAKELYSLISSKWLHVRNDMTNFRIIYI